MSEINRADYIHISLTVLFLFIYAILCSITDYNDYNKLSKTNQNISISRIIFGFLSALLLLSIEFRFVSIYFKDRPDIRFIELVLCLSIIFSYLIANESKRSPNDSNDKLSKIIGPILIALSIMASGSINTVFNSLKNIKVA